MTETTQRAAIDSGAVARLSFALRQAAFMAVALLVGGLVTQRLQPAEAFDRGFVATPFLWAIVVWCVVLAVNAIAFERSQMRSLERKPLYAATAIGAMMFVIGLVSYDDGPAARRVAYLVANSLSGIMFWWAVISLGVLVNRRLASASESTTT